MKRRNFLKKAAIGGVGLSCFPTILPARTVFKRFRAPKVDHVVVVLFAGGIRNQESVEKGYLAAQGGGTGNIMPNMFSGAQPTSNLIYDQWDPAVVNPLEMSGTTYRNLRYASGPTGHFNGYSTALTGNYTTNDLSLASHPEFPTLFEYYRKHGADSPDASNCWWVSQNLGPYTLLNYSQHIMYGSQYGANHLRPSSLFDELGASYFQNANGFHPEEQARISNISNFLNNRFEVPIEANVDGIENTRANRERIKSYLADVYNQQIPLDLALPEGVGMNELNGDNIAISMGWSIMDNFSPELMVLSTFDSDVCHSNFTGYMRNMHKADYAVGWLWNKIQTSPKFANKTALICMPEFGRNEEPNNLYDEFGLRAFDHTNDENSRNTFGMILGPSGVVHQNKQVGGPGNPQGEVIGLVPTVANLLDFRQDIPSGMLPGNAWEEALL